MYYDLIIATPPLLLEGQSGIMVRRSLLDSVTHRMAAAFEELTALEREHYALSIRAAVAEFPGQLLADDELPASGPRWSLRKVRLFPLGDFRRIYLPPIIGYTTLYLGDDRRLYEYGPRVLNWSVASNTLAYRLVRTNKLSIGELHVCHDLLERIWLV